MEVLVRQRQAAFEEQTVGHRRGPAHLREVGRSRVVVDDRIGRQQPVRRPLTVEMVADLLVHLLLGADLVLGRNLPRQAQALVAVAIALEGGPARIRRVDVRTLRVEVVEHPRDGLIRLPESHRPEEPQRVFLDRAAQRGIHVVDEVHPIDRRQTAVLQVLGQVVALERVVGERAEEVPLEGVAAVLRNHVAPDAAHLALGRETGCLEADFRDGGVVGGDGGEAAAPSLPVVVGHAVVQQLHLLGAAVVDRDRGGAVDGSAHILADRRDAGISTPRTIADLVPAGTALMMSRVITRCCTTFCTSTVGASPVTVIVSSTRADPQVGVDRRRETTPSARSPPA